MAEACFPISEILYLRVHRISDIVMYITVMEVTVVDFYGREQELEILEKNWKGVGKKARMVVITGRRRIGKTLLSMVYSKNKPHLYLFIAKKSEILLCQELLREIKATFDVPIIGEITRFREIFTL